MDTAELIGQARALHGRIQRYRASDGQAGHAAKAQVCEFLRQYAGANSAFTKQAEAMIGNASHTIATLSVIVVSFIEYLEAGLSTDLSPERRAQIDVVSDFLEQANSMLENTGFHPAAPAVIVGAALEEFLRTWVEGEGIELGEAKPGIDAYAKALRSAELITKQDVKDITSWAGTRNHAAHGEWEHVSDRERIRLMLEGVNLFLRKNTPE